MANTKILKRTPKKSIKRHNRHRHRRIRRSYGQPRCSCAAGVTTVLASINHSIFTCHRRLLRVFSKLTRLNHRHGPKGFKILGNHEIEPEFLTSLCPEIPTLGDRRTIFLDLDETLVHSSTDPPAIQHDFVVRPVIDGETMTFFVVKRPGVDEFLSKIGEKYEVVVFTAGLKEYASLVLERLDREQRVISHALYRDACREVGGRLVKDLTATGRDLGRVVIIDDNPNSYALQPENAVPIKPFVNDLEDRELERLWKVLDGCAEAEDMRVVVREFFAKEGM